MRRLSEPSHLDLRCLTLGLSTLRIHFFPSDSFFFSFIFYFFFFLFVFKADDKCRLKFGAEREGFTVIRSYISGILSRAIYEAAGAVIQEEVRTKRKIPLCTLSIYYQVSFSLSTHHTHQEKAQSRYIMKTRLYNFDPLKPHFYIVKLGFTGVYIIFVISVKKHRLWVFVRTASTRRF